MMKLRNYQKECAKEAIKWISKKKGNPIIAAPTGSGKSLILCEVINRFLTAYPEKNVLVISHVKEILDQNYNKLWDYFGGEIISLYSAGLQEKEISKITVAGIQSIHNTVESFHNTGLLIVDECHMINHRDVGMYRKLLKGIDAPLIGLTATPFRASHGWIYKGEDAIFDGISSNWITGRKFNHLIRKGYLSPIVAQQTDTDMDTTDIPIVAGEFNQKKLSQKFDKDSITKSAVNEIVKKGSKYRKWLIFSIDIKHAEHIEETLKNEHEIKCLTVHSKMKDEQRNKAITSFRNGDIQCLIGVNVPTTGFDVPDIDLIAMLCPIQSVVKYVQSAGRGLRPAKNKEHCLLLDFGDNVERLGPINNPLVVQKGKRKKGEQIMKACPKCKTLHPPAKKKCSHCGHEFEFKVKINPESSNRNVLEGFGEEAIVSTKGNITRVIGGKAWLVIYRVVYFRHVARYTNRECINAIYHSRQYHKPIHQYIHPYAPGYIGRQAIKFISRRTDGKIASHIPLIVNDLNKGLKPARIKVDFTGEFPQVIDYRFEEKRDPIHGTQSTIFTYDNQP